MAFGSFTIQPSSRPESNRVFVARNEELVDADLENAGIL
jgi:hypothetical protein